MWATYAPHPEAHLKTPVERVNVAGLRKRHFAGRSPDALRPPPGSTPERGPSVARDRLWGQPAVLDVEGAAGVVDDAAALAASSAASRAGDSLAS